MSINHDHLNKPKQKSKNVISVKIYELNDIRSISIDLSNGKDRSKLKHILAHERYRLRKRDIKKYEELLEQKNF